MPPNVNEGAYRISGRYGEAFYLDPTGTRPPLKVVEATALTFSKTLGQEDVPLSGNRTGTKDTAEEPGTGQLTIQKIDHWFENIVFEALFASNNLEARRAARDRGERRFTRTFTLQVWEDDPEALGAIGHELQGVRLSTYEGGFDYGQTITQREYPFRFEHVKKIRAFERIGNQIDEITGLPAIRYTDGAPATA